MIYQLSTHVPIEKKKRFYQKRKKTLLVHQNTPHVHQKEKKALPTLK